jgi:hypothetical protein
MEFSSLTAPPFFSQRTALADLELNNRLPGIFGSKEYVEVGGLMSYGSQIATPSRS